MATRTIVSEMIGIIPASKGDWVSGTAYAQDNQVKMYNCVLSSKHDNNTTTPMTWDGAETFTFNTEHWDVVMDGTAQFLADKDKPASTGTTGDYPYNGMGRVDLPKNMVNTGTSESPVMVNQLTQDMFYKGADGSRVPNTNTIFVIKYDYVLAENITIPSGCVLQFDGGSIKGDGVKTITGYSTNIVSNCDNIFDNIVFAGTWHIVRIIANWFKGATDADMFNAAFTFAALTSTKEGHSQYTGDEFNTVTCRPNSYEISKTINIPQYVSFDGNGAMFRITDDFSGTSVETAIGTKQFVFIVGTSYGNRGHNISIGNLNLSNTAELNIGGFYVNNAHYIHDIRSFRLNNLIIFNANYVDEKSIERVSIEYPRTNINYNNFDVADADIYIGLGDNAYLNNIGGCSLYVANQSQVKVVNIMPFYVYLNNIDECVIDNMHNEAAGGVYIKGVSRLTIKNSYLQINNNEYPKFIFDTDPLNVASAGELVLDNCRFYNNEKSVSILKDIFQGQPRAIIFKNTYCLFNASGNDHINGVYTKLRYKVLSNYHPGTGQPEYKYVFINDVYQVIKGGVITEDKTSFNNAITLQKGRFFGTSDDGVVYVNRSFMLDTKRNIRANVNTVPWGTDYPDTVRINTGDFGVTNIDVYSVNYVLAPEYISGVVMRLEFGKLVDGNIVYSKYIDIPVCRRFTAISFKLSEDSGDAFGYKIESNFSNDVAVAIDYGAYVEAKFYKRSEDNVEVGITTDTPPATTYFMDYDKLILSNGKILTKISSNWVDATGATV